jgi:ACS family hexuronate transporter-like MFS transporter
MKQFSAMRWWLVGALFLASVLNYLDRQTLSILAPTIQKDLQISDSAYAGIVNLFLVAYTLAYIFSGRLTDKLGTRLSLALFVGWWSLANMLTGWARSLVSLGTCRFLLGLGEAGNYTVGPKVVSEWFPAKERGVAIGLYTLGATIGATIAPIIVVHLADRYSWRTAFMTTGALGLLWLVPWLLLYPRNKPTAVAPTNETIVVAETPKPSEWELWRSVLMRRDVWTLMLARLLTDPVWYFYQFWLAKYLSADRGLQQNQLSITWVVFLAADIGTVLGGFLSGRLISRGRTPITARLAIMLACACLMPLSPFVAFAPSLALSLGITMVLVLAHLMWLTNLGALVVDLIPQRIIATAFGIVAAGSTVGGILMNSIVGWMVTGHSYTAWFIVMAFLHPIAWLLLKTLDSRKPLTEER